MGWWNWPRCQFRQCFSHAFFVRKPFFLVTFWLWINIPTKNARVKCWWNWPRMKKKTEIFVSVRGAVGKKDHSAAFFPFTFSSLSTAFSHLCLTALHLALPFQSPFNVVPFLSTNSSVAASRLDLELVCCHRHPHKHKLWFTTTCHNCKQITLIEDVKKLERKCNAVAVLTLRSNGGGQGWWRMKKFDKNVRQKTVRQKQSVF